MCKRAHGPGMRETLNSTAISLVFALRLLNKLITSPSKHRCGSPFRLIRTPLIYVPQEDRSVTLQDGGRNEPSSGSIVRSFNDTWQCILLSHGRSTTAAALPSSASTCGSRPIIVRSKPREMAAGAVSATSGADSGVSRSAGSCSIRSIFYEPYL